MLTAKLLDKYADVLIWGLDTSRTTPYQPGDNVLVQYDLAGLKLAETLFAKLVDRGLNVVPRMVFTSRMELDFYSRGNDPQLSFIAPGTRELYENLHGSVYIIAPDSLTHLSGVDPKRIAQTAIARKPYRDILTRREEAGQFGWTLCVHPTAEYARCAGLTKKEFTEQVIKACHLRAADPVAEWRRIHKDATTIKEWINALDVEAYHVESANVDLTVTPGLKRRFIGISGHNIPSFELFLSPDWRGTEGVYFADQPSYRNGNLVRGVRLEFREGMVTDVKAEEGEEFVKKQVAMDAGASRLGEFSLTDRRFSRIDRFMANTLFDENFGGEHGNCHVALGSSYSDTYDGDPAELTEARKAELGFNDSALHWDLVNTEPKRVTARLRGGGIKVVYENGQFAC
ncbi:Aminopeptidase PepS [Fundidesulfovibrio magnetotacticus]|uniref:Aminopeptidase PepS n=1 Tax=Fundidesulfovibrio magnetotacticus TaxID=2730080 RepID=A0A6V8LW28_9BACT|nr:aminopeptidase [Fundidesulfovibrio magnetotacticus]GFK94518.1 Aminopeptidase PepS [Fundidesulfovibrio magnetotacticus]